MTNMATAHRLVDAGLFVLPCDPETKAPLLHQWPTRATNQRNGVNYYWERYGLASMPGIAMGLSGLIAIDIDVKNGVDGLSRFDALLDSHGDTPKCPVTLTPSGGYHLIFAQPVGRPPLTNAKGALPPGIDIRGAGGQVIAPGAVRSDGTYYESVVGWPELDDAYAVGNIPEIPAWLIEIIEADRAANVRGPSNGERPQQATGDKSAWVAEGLLREAQALATTTEGGRNNALYKLVCTFAGHASNGWTTREEVYAAAWWACELNGYLASKAANDGPKQFRKTFDSGWRWGHAHPTTGPRERLTDTAPPIMLKVGART